jgi:hypothetical protein
MDTKQEITSKLKFIGKINKREKINTQYMYVQPDGVGTSLSRTFLYQDNRSNTLNFIQDTICRAFDLLAKYERSKVNSDRIHYRLLVTDLKNATLGIANLKITYKDDTKFCCDMDTILEFIHANLIHLFKTELDNEYVETSTDIDDNSTIIDESDESDESESKRISDDMTR